MFEFLETNLPDCLEISPPDHTDPRGRFVKAFQEETFSDRNLNSVWPEAFYSVSNKDVLRGLHFQMPPHDYEKLVICVSGDVLDVVLDLRKGSPTYGQHARFCLSSTTARMLYIPKGMAHGFLTLSATATMMYLVSTTHSPQHDTGILWNSAGIDWPVKTPILSERDAVLLSLHDFDSPFSYQKSL